ncbi:MAG: laccase domain-containing protein [Acidobacteria bacterium]|nr:laccase domain-containing protein [Acidobacteriota bacterium]
MPPQPQPNGGFAWVQAANGPALVCRPLEAAARHLFTARAWSLGSAAAGRQDAAWSEISAAAGVETSCLVRVHQVHGAGILVRRAGAEPPQVDSTASGRPQADIIVSNDGGLALAVQTADCVPLLIADPRTGAAAAVHAGWRGLAVCAPRLAVEALAREFDSRAADLIAAIGPSIGACCYEVGPDVRAAFERAGCGGEAGDWFSEAPQPDSTNPSMRGLTAARRPNRWFFDAAAAARHQLLAAGVPATGIHSAGLCTASHASLCSYRRDAAHAGRMAAVIRPQGLTPG